MMEKDDDIILINNIISKIPKEYLTKSIKDTFGNIIDYSIKGLTLKTNDVILNEINISDNDVINLKCSYKQDITYFLVGDCINRNTMWGLAYNDKLGYVLLDMSNLKLLKQKNTSEVQDVRLIIGANSKASMDYYMKNNIIIKSVHK